MKEGESSPGVERHWPRYRWDGRGQSRWTGWGWHHYLVIVTSAFLLAATFLESAVAKGGEKTPWPLFGRLAQGPYGIALLIALLAANAWCIDRALADRTPFERFLRPWLRGLRHAMVSVPIFGLYAIPLWRWVVEARPSWAQRPAVEPFLDLSTPRPELLGFCGRLSSRVNSQRRIQGQSFTALFLWMIAGQAGPWFALLSALMTAPSLSPSRRGALVGMSFAFHLLACACGLQYGVLRGGQVRAGRWRRFVLRWMPISFLFGFLAWILGLPAWLMAMNEERETLVGRSWLRKSSTSSQILRARWAAIRPTPFSTSQQNSTIAQARFAFYRLKLLILFFDAAALAWLAARRGAPFFDAQSALLSQLAPCLLLVALGLLSEGISLVIGVVGQLRLSERQWLPYGRWLALPQAVLASGGLFGALLAMDQVTTAGRLLVVTGMGGLLLTAIFTSAGFLRERSEVQIFLALGWLVLFLALIVAGGLMAVRPALSGPFQIAVKAAMILSPVWSLALVYGLGGWLIHPFRPRHIFDRRLPLRFRLVLAAVCGTAALPFGAVLVPFWIYACHWLWRRYQPLLGPGAG